MKFVDLTDKDLRQRISNLSILLSDESSHSDIGDPMLVMVARWIKLALEEYHGKPLDHGDHDFAFQDTYGKSFDDFLSDRVKRS